MKDHSPHVLNSKAPGVLAVSCPYWSRSPLAWSMPIAMGELYVNQNEYPPVIRDRLIDFIRVHISDIGGLTPARKLATLCEFFGVRTAWHGPSDTSPVGLAANLHLDLNAPHFGIQEQTTPFLRSDTGSLPGLSGDPGRQPVG